MGSSNNKQCAILTPVYNTPERRTEDALLELSRRGYTVRYLIGCSDIVLARSVMATEAVEDGFAETMWIDADIDFDPDDVDRLPQAVEHQYRLIEGGLHTGSTG